MARRGFGRVPEPAYDCCCDKRCVTDPGEAVQRTSRIMPFLAATYIIITFINSMAKRELPQVPRMSSITRPWARKARSLGKTRMLLKADAISICERLSRIV